MKPKPLLKTGGWGGAQALPPTILRGLLSQVPFKGGFRLTKPEDLFAYALANRLRELSVKGRLRAVWCHVPNEVGAVGKARGENGAYHSTPASRSASLRYTLARALGLVPGTADYLFLGPAGSLALELKVGRGSMSDNQKTFARWCADVGVPYVLATAASPEPADTAAAIAAIEGVLTEVGFLT